MPRAITVQTVLYQYQMLFEEDISNFLKEFYSYKEKWECKVTFSSSDSEAVEAV